jgi:hypothetical protein
MSKDNRNSHAAHEIFRSIGPYGIPHHMAGSGLSKKTEAGRLSSKLNEQQFSPRRLPAIDGPNYHIKNRRQKQGRSLAHVL